MVDADTYAAYREGQRLATFGRAESAIAQLQRASTGTPDFAPALAETARIRWNRTLARPRSPSREASRAMQEASLTEVRRAIELDADLAFAHTTLEWFQFWSLEFGAAETSFRRALAIDASDPRALHGYAFVLKTTGRADEGIELMHQARRLDPRSVMAVVGSQGPWIAAGRLDEAAAAVLAGDEWATSWPLAMAYTGLGDSDAALDIMERLFELGGARPELTTLQGPWWDGLRTHARFRALLARMGAQASR